jgi:hypothetical protein
MTLVEMLVAMALLATVLGSLLSMGDVSTKLCETGVTRSNLEAAARRAVDRLTRELAGARSASLAALPESPQWLNSIDFDRPGAIRVGDGRVTWSTSRLEFRTATGEANDGLDNDGDGLVDEGTLVLVHDLAGADEITTVLAQGVREYLEGEIPNGQDDNGNGLIDERGVTFEREGDDLRLLLTLEGIGRDGNTVTRTLQTSVWSRN